MKITLILASSPTDALRGKEPFMPLSLPLIAGTAPDHDYTFIDMLAETGDVDTHQPADLVGISVRMTAEANAYRIADAFRARGVKVVLGGPQMSAVPHRAIEHADAVAIGEGETLWPRIVEDAAGDDLKRFYVCSPSPFEAGDQTAYVADPCPDLAGWPTTMRHLFRTKYRFDTVQAARGCPIGCDFCAVPGMFGRKLRLRPIDEVVAEIARFKSFYYLLDDTVFGRPAHYDYYLELYEAIAKLKPKNYWTGQANLDATATEAGRAVIRKAADAGLIYAMAGIESINPAVLKASGTIRKAGFGADVDVIARMKEQIAFMQDLGILVSGWFTVGYPDDDLETYTRTAAFCREASILPVLSPLTALAGTPLHDRLKAEGGLDAADGLTNVAHPAMDRTEVVDLLNRVVDEGYGFRGIISRTWTAARRAARGGHRSVRDRIYQFIFSLVLQINMGKILRRENQNLKTGASKGIPV